MWNASNAMCAQDARAGSSPREPAESEATAECEIRPSDAAGRLEGEKGEPLLEFRPQFSPWAASECGKGVEIDRDPEAWPVRDLEEAVVAEPPG